MLVLEHVSKVFPGGYCAVDGIDLEVARGEFICLIGPSGCGKTTTLEMINRLVEPTAGTISVGGKDTSQMRIEELRRDIGYVIQQIGLFPHMTIEQNIAVVPRLKGWDQDRIRQRVTELMELVSLDPAVYGKRYPKEMSGGQQQRIGVLRALAAEPDLILMDEPFGALDPITRDQLQDELKNLQQRVHKTVVFVTHDMAEAVKLADRVVFMRGGKILQADAPQELLRRPRDEFVRDFIGRHGPGVTAGDAMLPLPTVLGAELTINAAIAELRASHHDTGVVVNGGGRYRGLVHLNALEAAHLENPRAQVGDLVQEELPVVRTTQSAEEVAQIMDSQGLRFVPVVDAGGRLAGVMTHTAAWLAATAQEV